MNEVDDHKEGPALKESVVVLKMKDAWVETSFLPSFKCFPPKISISFSVI